MSIRLRRIDGILVALCAARSVAKPGDTYLDDEQHYALASKFADDWDRRTDDAKLLRDAEESNNPNREWWDSVYGALAE